MSIPHISVSNLAWFCSLYASALSSSSDLVRIVFFDGCYRDFSSVHELDIVFLSDKLGLYNMVYFLLDQLHASNEEHIFQLGSTASLCHSQMTLLTLARMRSEGYGSCPVCVCVRGPHLRLAQLSDKLDILAVSVSCWLVLKKGVFRIMASFRR